MKDRRGFTLIELLVAITIVAIIMIMTLPAIRNVQRENEKKKFDDYERAVLEAAKAYEDQYEEDLFGRSDTGCAYIDFNSLVQKKLLATTKISGYECKNSNNGIIVRKVKGTSYYEVYLTCSNGKPSGTKNLTGNTGDYNYIKDELCSAGEDTIPPELTIRCDGESYPERGIKGDDFKDEIYYYSATNTVGLKKLPQLSVEVADNIVGLEKNQYVTYEWRMYQNKAEDSLNFTEKNKTTFNTKDGTLSIAKKKVRIIEQFKEKNKTGKAVVDIRGTNIVDRIGNRLNPETAYEQCKYYYDNAKPKITITLTGASGRNYNIDRNDWINEPITTTVTVTDKTPNDIYSGIEMNSFENSNIDGVTLSKKDENTGTHTYTRVDTNRKQTDEYTVCDKVGNCTSQTVIIRVDTTYPTCKSRDGDPNWRNRNITINGDCKDNGDPAHYSDCEQRVYFTTYSDEQSINNATAGRACDNAGNCVTCSEDQPVHIDKTIPDCTTEGESTDWAKTRTIKFNCEDPISGGVSSNCTKTTSETIVYADTKKTASHKWYIEDNAGNTRTCINSKVNVYMDNTDPICTHSISGENNPGQSVTVSLTCNEPDGELRAVGNADFTLGGAAFSDNILTAPEGGSLHSPYTHTRHLLEGQYGIVCFNKAGGSCIFTAEVVQATCNKCPEDCCPSGYYKSGNHCCIRSGGNVGGLDCQGVSTCYTKRCTSAKYCGYKVK